MRFQWDPVKARTNLHKHGVDFADAVGVFEDSLALTLEDPHPAEDRFLTLGSISWAELSWGTGPGATTTSV